MLSVQFTPTVQGVNTKGFYLFLYTIVLRTLSRSPLNIVQLKDYLSKMTVSLRSQSSDFTFSFFDAANTKW